ncbi:MAG: hypothetical protein K0Q51_505 [Rickettsiaceae bacterium]|jgi:cytoplasmic iron level regulating protein YaaA (DUF328/UPF0246 family)|nr:hypothetical protein [Rickettsiaceae bacterium]
MLTIISPSKTQDYKVNSNINGSIPEFIQEAKELVQICKKLSAVEIAKLMDLSPKLAESTYTKFQEFDSPDNSRKIALLAYTGDVYNAMNPAKYSQNDLHFADQHLRIISGLYGLLRPLDLIHPYRLEMAIRLNNPKGKDLYHFWHDKLTENISNTLAKHANKTLINLCSDEYANAIDFRKLKGNFINISFKENKNGKLQTIGLLAKKARGMMADFIISNKIDDSKDLKGFSTSGYCFNNELSNEQELVFTR